jgi:hypothetical protein
MKFVKITIIAVVIGLAASLLPKIGSAADVSVGLSFGVPFPAVAVYPAVPHPQPVAVVPVPAPAAYYPAYHHYHHHAYGHGPSYRHYQDQGYWGRGYGNIWNRHHHDRR